MHDFTSLGFNIRENSWAQMGWLGVTIATKWWLEFFPTQNWCFADLWDHVDTRSKHFNHVDSPLFFWNRLCDWSLLHAVRILARKEVYKPRAPLSFPVHQLFFLLLRSKRWGSKLKYLESLLFSPNTIAMKTCFCALLSHSKTQNRFWRWQCLFGHRTEDDRKMCCSPRNSPITRPMSSSLLSRSTWNLQKRRD